MSAEAQPITPTAFAAALKDLPLSSLHLKVLELRNSIAHLDYSNEQLRPYAQGIATALSSGGTGAQSSAQEQAAQPDQDCIDAIKENEQVIERMQERIRLVRAEVEERGISWAEFQSEAEGKAEGKEDAGQGEDVEMVNGVNGGSTSDQEGARRSHSAWSDGTFQTGVIRDGVVHMDSRGGERQAGGSLTDEELRRRMEEQLRGLGEDDEDGGEGGLHL
ncbi:Spermatid-associated protein [Madurella mycetomatis]|uniref:Spermatid-associated protein n=1 Tax=Madurella mycetomatis TaxID=100816 RepID=A0A175W934_9PEZI|nr:Spermatid-associated protein [Madurella mycetomatis]